MQCHHQSFWLFGEGFLISFAVSPALTAMQPLRPSFCAPYQLARQVKGRPMCPHTKQACPYGLHACQLCGKGGHGAGDCRTIAAPPNPHVMPSRWGPQPQQIPDAARSEAAAVCTSKAGGEMPPDVAVVPTTSPSPPPMVEFVVYQTIPAPMREIFKSGFIQVLPQQCGGW